MSKQYTSPYNPAAKDLSQYIIEQARAGGIRPEGLAIMNNVLEGIEFTDHLLVQKDQVILQKDSVINQKTVEVQSKDRLLVQKEIEKEHAVRSKSIEKNNLLAQKEQLLIQKDRNIPQFGIRIA